MKYLHITIKNRSQSKTEKEWIDESEKNVLMNQMNDQKSSKQINRIKING